MALVNIDLNPDSKTLRQFGYIALVAFGALGLFTWWRSGLLGFTFSEGTAATVAWVLGGLGVVSGLLATVFPPAVKPIYVGMTLLTFPIGFVVSHVILVGLYYLVLTPVGLLLRIFGKDPMQRSFEPDATTYWEKKAPITDVRSYFRQY